MTEEASHREGSTRWWEFYAVRYAMGAVVGAIIFSYLCLQRSETQPLLFGIFGTFPRPVCNTVSVCAAACAEAASAMQSHSISLSTSHLTLLAVYGLVYCYVASAPILVFHAGRFLVNPATAWKWVVGIGGICAGLFLLGMFGGWLTFTATALALTLLLVMEVWVVVQSLKRSDALFEFYRQLARRRKESKGEIVDSYRHLREHGNSFFIVFFEFALGVVLFEASTLVSKDSCGPAPALEIIRVDLVVLVVWILPAICVWLISTLFERRFSDEQTQPELPPLPGL